MLVHTGDKPFTGPQHLRFFFGNSCSIRCVIFYTRMLSYLVELIELSSIITVHVVQTNSEESIETVLSSYAMKVSIDS